MTRSQFLVNKLRAYIYQMIQTLTSKIPELSEVSGVDASLEKSAGGLFTDANALSLRADSFPLITTFDNFLELLENTSR